jgi:hypothetical protein
MWGCMVEVVIVVVVVAVVGVVGADPNSSDRPYPFK